MASALLDTFCRFGELNLAFLTLEVRKSNAAAIGLYEKYGFEKTGHFKGFFKIDGQYVDFDLMNLML